MDDEWQPPDEEVIEFSHGPLLFRIWLEEEVVMYQCWHVADLIEHRPSVLTKKEFEELLRLQTRNP